jgi:hypothetical protein
MKPAALDDNDSILHINDVLTSREEIKERLEVSDVQLCSATVGSGRLRTETVEITD